MEDTEKLEIMFDMIKNKSFIYKNMYSNSVIYEWMRNILYVIQNILNNETYSWTTRLYELNNDRFNLNDDPEVFIYNQLEIVNTQKPNIKNILLIAFYIGLYNASYSNSLNKKNYILNKYDKLYINRIDKIIPKYDVSILSRSIPDYIFYEFINVLQI